jgi:hypothetical protein
LSQQESDGNYSLVIKGVKPEDAANYQAEFTNRAGEKKVNTQLTVHCKLELQWKPLNVISYIVLT